MALITISGTLLDASGAPIVGQTVKFQLTNFVANVPYVSGTNILVPLIVTAISNSSGIFSTSIQGNDTITPANTYYEVTYPSGVIGAYSFTGAGPINLDSYSALNPIPAPSGPVPTNLLTSNNVFSGTNSFTGTATFSGNNTHNGTETFGKINSQCIVDGVKYATLGAVLADTTCTDIYLPSGTFSLAPTDLSTVLGGAGQPTKLIRIRGNGVGNTTIQLSSAGDLFKAIVSNTFYGLELDDLTLDGHSLTGTRGLNISGLNKVSLRNLRFINFDTDAMLFNATVEVLMSNILIRQPVGTNAVCVHFSSAGAAGGTSTQVLMDNVRCDGYKTFIEADYDTTNHSSVGSLYCRNCNAGGTTSDTMQFTGASGIILENSDLETCGGDCVNVADTTINAGAIVSRLNIIGGFYNTTVSGKFPIKLDNAYETNFEWASMTGGQPGVNCSANTRLVTGYADVGTAPTGCGGFNSTVMRFAYTTTSTGMVDTSSDAPVFSQTTQTLTNKTLTTPIFSAITFASLGTPANGTFNYCSDCTIANPCAGSGTGALAKRLNGVWVCN